MLGGNGNGSSVNNAGSNGYYWSSTYNNTNNAYNMNFNSGGVNPQNNNNKYNGFAVRCVKKSEREGGRRVAVFTETVRVGSEFSNPPGGVGKWRSGGRL